MLATHTSALLWPDYLKTAPNLLQISRIRRTNLSRTLKQTLDRANVLGDNENYGHTGCVNAVSWAHNGDLLLTGGDDTTVRLWGMDTSDLKQEYPFVCRSVISTGHRANIFNVQMLPHSNRIVTCAGDRQIRIFDASAPLDIRDGRETQFSARQCCIRIIRCHTDRVKKLVTEDSPDVFLSLSEDGTVRQHDLRTHHTCREGTCPAPLMRVNHELATISMSPVTPYQFVVAGESPYGYLYDRRHIGRVLQEEWGAIPSMREDVTSCVRRFGRPPTSTSDRRREHITSSRISPTNGHEVLLSYSADKIYLFSTRDEPHSKESFASMASSILPPNSKSKPSGDKASCNPDEPSTLSTAPSQQEGSDRREEHEQDQEQEQDDQSEGEDEDIEALIEFDNDDGSGAGQDDFMPDIPVILPRSQYTGARNVATIKDVNFFGPFDEHIVSGSDDGNWFMWDKGTSKLEGIYEGDSSVVNVVEGHPHLPVVAVSGIDTSIKLFSPAIGKSLFSRMDRADQIIESNARQSRTRTVRYNLSSLLAHTALGGDLEGAAVLPDCTSQ